MWFIYLFIHLYFNTVYSPGYAVWPYWWQCLHPWLSVSILRPPSICCCSCQCNSASQVKPHLTSLLKRSITVLIPLEKQFPRIKSRNDVFTFQVFILLSAFVEANVCLSCMFYLLMKPHCYLCRIIVALLYIITIFLLCWSNSHG